jgi:predicted cobalt transporter CbtA
MPAAELGLRQVWWLGTTAMTGVAIYLVAVKGTPPAVAAAVVLAALPHLIGAPQPESHESVVPAGLSAAFAANSLAANAVFWILIGAFLGLALNREAGREQSA